MFLEVGAFRQIFTFTVGLLGTYFTLDALAIAYRLW